MSETGAPTIKSTLMPSIPATAALRCEYSSSVAGATHTPIKSALLEKIALTATKINPGSPPSRRLCRLLPQLVGSCDPGGVGVSGDGDAARIGAYQIEPYRRNLSTYNRAYAVDRAPSRISRSFSAASSVQRFAIRSKNFRSSAFFVFKAYHLH
jgi:hypothetical protein